MKVNISFTLPDDFDPNEPLARAVMDIEGALPDEADNFEWDTEDE